MQIQSRDIPACASRHGLVLRLTLWVVFTYNPAMRSLLTLILLLSLTACGFHLRGSVQLPPELGELTLVDAKPATDVAPELRRALQGQGVRLMEAAPLRLQLAAEHYGKRVLSVDAAGRAQEYGLSYMVRFSLLAADGVAWLPEETVTLTRDLRFDAAAVLATGNEEAQLKGEMRRDAVLQILRRLQYAKPPPAKVPAEKPVEKKETP